MKKLLFILILLASKLEAQTPARSIWKTNVQPFTCNSIQTGAIYYNTTDNRSYYCDGEEWVRFAFVRTSIDVDGSESFLEVTGTLPSVTTGVVNGIAFTITTAGSSSNIQRGIFFLVNGGYTGSSETSGIEVFDSIAGTANAWMTSRTGNRAIMATIASNTTGTNLGLIGNCQNSGSGDCIGVFGDTHSSTGSGHDTGVIGVGRSSGGTGGYFTLAQGSNPTIPHAALVADNGTVANAPIFIASDGGVSKFQIFDGGDIRISRTITAAGTTGAQTINEPGGAVNFAAAAATLVVTNNLVNTSSIIFVNRRTNDVTCFIAGAEPGAGSFTIRMTAACTAETSVGFLVTN